MRRGWHSRGYLPHRDDEGLVQHVVFRLADSLPAHVTEGLALLAKAEQRKRVDALLDRGLGERILEKPEVAFIVSSALRHFDGERNRLHAWCVMPNHVHAMIAPVGGQPLGAIVKSWKIFTARRINRLLDRDGPVWAPDYFDRFVRDDNHAAATFDYIEANPVAAGLCPSPADWPFSSASRERCT
ncbi:MAG: transposase [Terricaulis sp.]